jgi:hypothetical protein
LQCVHLCMQGRERQLLRRRRCGFRHRECRQHSVASFSLRFYVRHSRGVMPHYRRCLQHGSGQCCRARTDAAPIAVRHARRDAALRCAVRCSALLCGTVLCCAVLLGCLPAVPASLSLPLSPLAACCLSAFLAKRTEGSSSTAANIEFRDFIPDRLSRD